MTLNEVLEKVDTARPNSLTVDQKVDMISRLDAEAIKDADDTLSAPLMYDYDQQQELFIPFPFDDCYVLYCFAQMDLILADMSLYPNDSALFNVRYQEYRDWMTRTASVRPAQWGRRYLGT